MTTQNKDDIEFDAFHHRQMDQLHETAFTPVVVTTEDRVATQIQATAYERVEMAKLTHAHEVEVGGCVVLVIALVLAVWAITRLCRTQES